MNLTELSAQQLLVGFREKKFSPVEVLDAVFELIRRINSKVNAFLALDVDGAYKRARQAELEWVKGRPAGLLCGVPVSVKDSIEQAGIPTTYGSLAFVNNLRNDSVLVARLRSEGAVLFGKTNLPEFALRPETRNRLGEPGRNPWDLTRTSGGSSGGAGAAIAAGLGPIAIGTDSGGSIRGPSAQNGIFGLKPTFQRIPAVQDWRASHDRSHNGPMTRTVWDAALVMDAIAGYDSRDPNSNWSGPQCFAAALSRDVPLLSIGIAPCELTGDDATDVSRALADVIPILRGLGHTVRTVPYPPRYSALRSPEGIWPYSGDHLAAAEMLVPGFLARHRTDLTDYGTAVYEAGERLLAVDYRKALTHDMKYRMRIQQWLREQEIDLLIMDCVSSAPIIDDEGRSTDRESNGLAMFNIARLPVGIVPFGKSSTTGMPLGLQVVATMGDDLNVLSVCNQLEQSNFWISDYPRL